MNAKTLELIVITGSIVVLGGVGSLGLLAGVAKYQERRGTRNNLMPLYQQGLLEKRPTIFNCYKLSDKYNLQNP